MKRQLLFVLALCGGLCSVWAQTHVEFVTPDIVRVRWSADGTLTDNATGVCTYNLQKVNVKVRERGGVRSYTSSSLVVEENLQSQSLTFIDRKSGQVLLAENPAKAHESEPVVRERIVYDEKSAHMEETANGKVTVKDIIRRDTIGHSTRYRLHLQFQPDEALYGLGSHMEDYMNLRGKTLYLTQHNLKAMVPVLLSNRGYGLLFDAGCAMKWQDPMMELEAAKTLDYYFIRGGNMQGVVRGYHHLTGQVELMPRYVFGYTQSKERYVSSDDLLSTLGEYRRRHVPIDMIVQDWNYWPQGWGYMKMNRRFYPDPRALADSIHAMHGHLMVSIWPNPQNCPQEKDFRERGFMLEGSVYDVFNPEARKHYWKYANDEFFSQGFDAWWCDSSEPLDGDWNRLPAPENGKPYSWDDHERRWLLNQDILSDALTPERSSLYSLYHSRGIYENQRATSSAKRVVNLTRSTYAGQQRYGTIVWNGDTYASWESFRRQIPAGLNYMATGNPYWSVDVGCFFTGADGRWFRKGDFPKGINDEGYREFYTRMFQWGTFLPVLRSHGTDTPREIWRFGEPGTPYYDAILEMIRLRYSLIPYIYSMAAMQTHESYTMARPLVFDFPSDPTVFDLKDEYLFGNMLVCPVTAPGVTTRRVYLPQGTQWTDALTGVAYQGGQWIDAPTVVQRGSQTLLHIPVFVRAGSIIPTTAVAEYTDAQVGQPIQLHITPGADAQFSLYEDEGDNYNHEQGAYSIIPLRWDNKHRRLTIGARQGSYPGMQQVKTFVVGDRNIQYDGHAITIKL